jgi:hypothetical protein
MFSNFFFPPRSGGPHSRGRLGRSRDAADLALAHGFRHRSGSSGAGSFSRLGAFRHHGWQGPDPVGSGYSSDEWEDALPPSRIAAYAWEELATTELGHIGSTGNGSGGALDAEALRLAVLGMEPEPEVACLAASAEQHCLPTAAKAVSKPRKWRLSPWCLHSAKRSGSHRLPLTRRG